jgi:hypothetical protein
MSASTLTVATFPWPRAAAVLAITLLAHAWLFDRVQDILLGADRSPPEAMTVNARLLTPPAPEPPAAPRPQPRPAPLPRPRPASAPVIAFEPPPVTVDTRPIESAPPPEGASEELPPPMTQNAERPTEPVAAEPLEFDASGEALAEALSSLPSLNAALPATARYTYRTSYSELRLASGVTTVDWALAEDGGYRLRMATEALGVTLIELESTGRLREFGLAPERYTEARARRAATAANVDWQARRVTFSARAHERPLVEGVQDRISFQFQLMLLGQARPERFKAGRTTVMRVAGRDDVSTYTFRSVGLDRTATGRGPLDTVRVERVSATDTEARVEVWLAPDLGWVPVRLRFTDRHGRVTESVLESASTP